MKTTAIYRNSRNMRRKLAAIMTVAALVSELISPIAAFAGGSGNATFTNPGTYSWTVPAGVTSIDVKAWAGGGAGGSGTKTDNSNLSGLGGGGGGYSEQTISVQAGSTYSVTVGAGGQSSGQNGGQSEFSGAGINLVTTGGVAGASNTGTGPGYPTTGGGGGIGNGGNAATNLGGGNGGTEGCDPNNCSGNARASGGGGAAAGGAGGAGLGFGDIAGTSGSSGTTNISGGGSGGSAGWQGRDGSCNGGCGAGGPNATDGNFPGGGGGGSDTGTGGYGANGEVVITDETPATPAPSVSISVSANSVTVGGSVHVSGTATGQNLSRDGVEICFVTVGCAQNSSGSGWVNVDANNSVAGSPDSIAADPVFSNAGDYYVRGYVSNDGGVTYQYSSVITVTASASSGGGNNTGGGNTGNNNGNGNSSNSFNLPPNISINVDQNTITAGGSVHISAEASGSNLTGDGIQMCSTSGNCPTTAQGGDWQTIYDNGSVSAANGIDDFSTDQIFSNTGTYYVRSFASNDGGNTFAFSVPLTITVNASTGGTTPPNNGNPVPGSNIPPNVSVTVDQNTITLGSSVHIMGEATGAGLTNDGLEYCTTSGNCPTSAHGGDWQSVYSNNAVSAGNGIDDFSANETFPNVGSYYVRSYASNDSGNTFAFSTPLTVNVNPASSSGGSGSAPVTHSLTVTVLNGGLVRDNTGGISCTSSSGCSAIYNQGTTVLLTATPNTGDILSSWSGVCAGQATTTPCDIVMNSDLMVTATFASSTAATSTASTTPSNGSITPPIISGPTSGVINTTYTFTASSTAPNNDQVFFVFDTNNDGVYGASTTPVASGMPATFTHSWDTAGTQTFSVAAVDNTTGASATSTYTIAISDNSSGGGSSGSSGGSSGSSGSSGGGSGIPGICIGYGCATNTQVTTTGNVTSYPSVTTVANTPTQVPVVPVVGPSVCKAGDYITAYMKEGINNDPQEVTKLQTFLNEYEGDHLEVTGVFDASTTEAVKDFQTKYATDVLSPWGITAPTGIVYITTAHEINNIYCSSNPTYVGGTGATTTPSFNGAVGIATSTSNIAGVIGAITDGLKNFLKDILWYPVLILILLGTGFWLIMRYITLKDIKDKQDPGKRNYLINGIACFAIGSVLNAINTLFYIISPATFTAITHMYTGLILALDLINLVLILTIMIAVLFMIQEYFLKNAGQKQPA